MAKETFVYEIYIAATRERVWKALLQPEFTREYWGGHDNISDWRPGSTWEHRKVDTSELRIVGEVVEVDPPQRLVITWAFPADSGNPSAHSRVTFELTQIENMVRLTVTHAELQPGSDMERGIKEGWPRVLSSLKSYLETGKPLPVWAGKR